MSFHSRMRADERGSSFIEFLLLFPLLFFLFLGAFDMGFLCYAFIGTQNAARVAALYMSSPGANATSACLYVRTELATMPNSSQFPSSCGAIPLQVTVLSTTGPDGLPAKTVTVSYQTIRLPAVPIPGFTPQFTITRSAQMRVRT
jgi:Flp pilus assembly protein TadG